MRKIYLLIIILFGFSINVHAEGNRIISGKKNAKIKFGLIHKIRVQTRMGLLHLIRWLYRKVIWIQLEIRMKHLDLGL